MKKIFLTVFVLLFICCEKAERDYRYDFLGTYICYVKRVDFNLMEYGEFCTTEDDTINVESYRDSLVRFVSLNGSMLFTAKDIFVDKDGFFDVCIDNMCKGAVRGKFIKDSLFVHYGYSNGVAGWSHDYYCVKVKL